MYMQFDLTEVVFAGEAALFVSFVLGVVLHEAGHAVAAWAMGLDVRLVALGLGRPVLRLRWRRVSFVLCSLPMSGFVQLAVQPGMSRYRYAAMIAAGPLANGLLLGLVAILDETAPYYDAVLVPAGVAQALLLALALFPKRYRARGGLRPSDGLQLWTQLVRKPGDMFALLYAAILHQVFPAGHPVSPPSPRAPELAYQLMRSDRFFDPWALQDTATSVRALLVPWQLHAAERAVALEFLASLEVLFGGTGATDNELEAWSQEAHALAPGLATALTRAGVLANTGRAEQAMRILEALPEADRPVVAIFRYWLHMAQASAERGLASLTESSLRLAREAANGKVVQRAVMRRILARAERMPPLAAVDQANGTAISGA